MIRLAMSGRERRIGALATLVATVSLAGCVSGGGEADVSAETLRAASALTEFPAEIGIAQQVLTQECVRDAGFDMPFDTSAARQESLSFGISNVFTSREEAERVGYTSTLARGDQIVDDWANDLSATDREAFYRALLGPDDAEQVTMETANGLGMSAPSEGCISEANAQLYGSVEASLSFNVLVNEYLSAASGSGDTRDARLGEVVPDFESCMKQQGYDVDGLGTPALAEKLFGAYRAPGEAPSEEEKALAAADFGCQQEISLRTILREAFVEDSGAWLRANEGKLLAMQEELSAVKERAIEVINE